MVAQSVVEATERPTTAYLRTPAESGKLFPRVRAPAEGHATAPGCLDPRFAAEPARARDQRGGWQCPRPHGASVLDRIGKRRRRVRRCRPRCRSACPRAPRRRPFSPYTTAITPNAEEAAATSMCRASAGE